jgi:RNA polymerase sigma-70 factor, ECF subfamily
MKTSLTERELVAQSRQGDIDAYSELVRIYQARLRAYTAAYIRCGADVLDLVQEAFLDGLKNIDRFDTQREFGPWIFAICRNRIRNHIRTIHRRVEQPAADVEVEIALEKRLASDGSTGEGLEDKLLQLRQCMGQLKERHRQMIALRYQENLHVKEIAARFEQSPASITMFFQRIRSILRKCMETRVMEAAYDA